MKRFFIVAILSVFLIACGMVSSIGIFGNAVPTTTDLPTPGLIAFPQGTATLTLTPSVTPLPAPEYPLAGYGPSNFPADVDPLTGLKVGDPSILERRPLIIKVSNLPRGIRPQWGLSLADNVYEYYTEEGTTRFAAVFYGQDASMAWWDRSARGAFLTTT